MDYKLNIGFLWLEAPGYLINCLANLSQNVERVVLLYTNGNLPEDVIKINSSLLEAKKLILMDATEMTAQQVHEVLALNKVRALIVCGWHHKKWMRVSLRYSGIKILTFDNQWKGSIRQLFGMLYGKLLLSHIFDGAFVPGSRTKIFAEKIGFSNSHIVEGLYVGNNSLFTPNYSGVKKDFLFAGRLVAEKNIQDLLDGYKTYREHVSDPWNLKIAGQGPLEAILSNYEGVNYVGQLSQTKLSMEMRNARFLVLPSLSEPWGVVVHESVLAGTPVICSANCGSSDYYVHDNKSGFILKSVDSKNISAYLIKAHHQQMQDYIQMCELSEDLAKKFTPDTWTKSVLKLLSMNATK